jgi:elongation factor Ts
MDNKTPIAQVVEAAGKAAGTKIALVDYVRFQLGEGIEKEEPTSRPKWLLLPV